MKEVKSRITLNSISFKYVKGRTHERYMYYVITYVNFSEQTSPFGEMLVSYFLLLHWTLDLKDICLPLNKTKTQITAT